MITKEITLYKFEELSEEAIIEDILSNDYECKYQENGTKF